jgi:hypothetical protein
MCSASITGGVTAASTCALTAVYAASAGNTSVAFSGKLTGTSDVWDGISFIVPGRPANGSYDLSKLMSVSGDLGDPSGDDTWILSGGTDVAGGSTGTFSFGVSAASVAASESVGDIYDLHGSASARLKYTGSKSGQADVIITLAY